MSEHQVRRLPVVENDRIVGIVSLGDLAVKEAKDKRVGDTFVHILRAAGNRVALDGDVASRSGRGDAILHDREDHERRDRRDEENCARPHRHQFDYTVPLGARTLVCFCYQ